MHVGAKATKSKGNDVESERCEVMEIVQFMCNFVGDRKPEPSRATNPAKFECVPYPRIFRMCVKTVSFYVQIIWID